MKKRGRKAQAGHGYIRFQPKAPMFTAIADRVAAADRAWFKANAGETTRVRAYVPGEFGTSHLDYNATLVRVTRYERGIARQALTIPGDRWQDGIPASEFLLAALADGRIADVFAPELPHDLTSPLIGEAMS